MSDVRCGVSGCVRDVAVKKAQMCMGHYNRLRKHGSALPDVPLRTMGMPGRGRPHYSKTLSDGEAKRGHRDDHGRIRDHGVPATGILEAPGR